MSLGITAEVKNKMWFGMNKAFRRLIEEWTVLEVSGAAMLQMEAGCVFANSCLLLHCCTCHLRIAIRNLRKKTKAKNVAMTSSRHRLRMPQLLE